MRKGDKPIIVEKNFRTPIDTVWDSITNADQMRQWYFANIPEFEAEVGFETRFNVRSGDKDFLHLWRITEVVPQQKIRYNWKYANYAGEAFVKFELFRENSETRLKVTCDVVESFPEDIPEFATESCRAGWEYFINDRLKDYLKTKS